MQTYIISPDLLLFGDSGSKEDFEAHASALLRAANPLYPHSLARMAVNRDLMLALATSGALPVDGQIQTTLDRLGLSHIYSAQDLVRFAYQLLALPTVEEVLGIRDVLYSEWVRPQDTKLDWSPIHGNELAHQLGLAIVMSFICRIAQTEAPIAKFIGRLSVHEHHSITCEMIDTASAKLNSVQLPQTIDGEILMLSAFSGYPQAFDAQTLWHTATCENDLKAAIACRVQELSGCLPGAGFSIGNHFQPSLAAWSASGNQPFAGSVLNQCARAVYDPASDARPFRQNGENLQRADGARGMRAHVTEHGVALRLHYWIADDGQVELVNVGGKHELRFPL